MTPPDATRPEAGPDQRPGGPEPRVVIGLEVHARLATRSKLFCGCESGSGGSPNSRICPVCTGFPGTLPYPNREALRLAVRAASLLGARLSTVSRWSRKHYFYPDLPKGYQITQHEEPLAQGGELRFGREDGSWCRVALRGLHVEEDAGKSVHEGLGEGVTGIDFNRCGVPLVEIVTEPCLATPEDAGRCLEQLRALLRGGGVSDANMDEGSLRCDANVSLQRGGDVAGERVEIKNLNSFRFVRAALAHEIERQGALLARGQRVERETRLWDASRGETRPMRGKEDVLDYRYLREEDLPPLVIDAALLEDATRDLPGTPDNLEESLREAGVGVANARVLALDPAAARYFDAARAAGANPGALETWMLVELGGRLARRGETWSNSPLAPRDLAGLVAALDAGRITSSQAKALLDASLTEGLAPLAIASRDGLEALTDPEALAAIVREVVSAHAEQVARYRAGKTALLGFLVGRVLEASGGRAEARLARAALRAELERER